MTGNMEAFNMSHFIKRQVCEIENDKSCVLLYIFLASLTAVTIGGNLLVIIAIFYFKQLHTPTNYLIFSLAVADMLMGLLIFPFNIAFSFTACSFVNLVHCKIRSSFDFTLSMSSILNLCCISFDRYYAVCYPLMYNSKFTDHFAVAMTIGTWVISILFGIVYLSLAFYYDLCMGECFMVLMILSLVAFYIPISVLFTMYCKILIVAQAQARSIQNVSCQTGPASSKKERKATKTMAIVMGLFLLCWVPLFILFPFQDLNNISIMLLEPFNWFAMSNSMFNPFIYAFFYKWFRSASHMIVSGKILRGDLSHTKLQ